MAGPAPADALAGRDAVVQPRRRERRAALVVGGQAAHAARPASSARATLSRGCGSPTPPDGARLGLGVGLLRRARRRARRRGRRAGRRLPRRGLRRLGARGAPGRGARDARRRRPDRDRPGRGLRGARDDADAVQARGRWPGRRRAAVHAVDPPRGRDRPAVRRAGPPGFSGPINGAAPEPVDEPRLLTRARPRAAPARRSRRSRPRRSRSSTATWPRSWSSGVRMVPGRADELGYTFRHPDLDEALGSTLQ